MTLPVVRPDEMQLAALANVRRLQRALSRARHVRLHIWGDAHAIVRAAARFGLIARVTVAARHTTLDIVGPLSLFHATRVYGRTLGLLVPYLAGCGQFVLELDVEYSSGPIALRVESPALLPPPPDDAVGARIVNRLAAALHKEAAVGLTIDPPPLVHGAGRLFPDLAIDTARGRWYVELVGFATSELLADKLARYAAAGVVDVVLVVDERYAAEGAVTSTDRRVIRYQARSAASDVLAIVGASR